MLEERAFSVNMHPDIEEACRDFLMDNCMERTGQGEEMQCLQASKGRTCLYAINEFRREC